MNSLMPQLLAAIAKAKAAGQDPLVVLDLDGTLYDNTMRTLRIIQEYVHSHAGAAPELHVAVGKLAPADMAYKISETLHSAGITDAALIKDIEAYWFERFFTNDYCLHDLPLAGAADFVRQIHEAGAVPTYLTGRDAPNMLQGTIAALQRDGFPVGRIDTRIILKQDFETPDLAYKTSVISSLRRTGHVVGSFDNEPGLCNLFKEAFPEAVVCWLDTSHAPGAPPLGPNIHTLGNFVEFFHAPA